MTIKRGSPPPRVGPSDPNQISQEKNPIAEDARYQRNAFFLYMVQNIRREILQQKAAKGWV